MHLIGFKINLIILNKISNKGFTRIIDLMPDISLDVPNVNNIMDKILNRCSSKGFVNDDIMDLASNR